VTREKCHCFFVIFIFVQGELRINDGRGDNNPVFILPVLIGRWDLVAVGCGVEGTLRIVQECGIPDCNSLTVPPRLLPDIKPNRIYNMPPPLLKIIRLVQIFFSGGKSCGTIVGISENKT
jgi:hypothetical protein